VVALVIKPRFLLIQSPPCLIDLAAKDGLNTRGLSGMMEPDHAVHLPVIGQCQRLHAQLAGATAQIGQSGEAVQK
jgi:hypothetical protein